MIRRAKSTLAGTVATATATTITITTTATASSGRAMGRGCKPPGCQAGKKGRQIVNKFIKRRRHTHTHTYSHTHAGDNYRSRKSNCRERERESKGGRLRRRHFCLSKYYTTRLVAYLQSTFSIPLLLLPLLPMPATTRCNAMQTAQKYAMKIKLKLVGNEKRGSPSSALAPVCIGQLTFVIVCVCGRGQIAAASWLCFRLHMLN